jgi:hypothetical protein
MPYWHVKECMWLKLGRWKQGNYSSASQSSSAIEVVVSSVVELQQWSISNTLNKLMSHSPGLGVNLRHHRMECIAVLSAHEIERVDIALVHIMKGIAGEFCSLLNTSTPLI